MPEPLPESDMSQALEIASLLLQQDVISRGEHCQNESFRRFSGGGCLPPARQRESRPRTVCGIDFDVFRLYFQHVIVLHPSHPSRSSLSEASVGREDWGEPLAGCLRLFFGEDELNYEKKRIEMVT